MQTEAEAAAKGRHLKELHDRILQVSIAVPKNAKKVAKTIVQSASPEPGAFVAGDDTDDNAANGGSRGGNFSSATPDPSTYPSASSGSSAADTRRDRTIALLNIPDTVNDARIRALVEPYGALRKIILIPERRGAIIEFQRVQDVGKAALALEGYTIILGKAPIAVGNVEEMLKSAARKDDSRPAGRSTKGGQHSNDKGKDAAKGKGRGKLPMAQSAVVSRPSLLGLGRRRGGKGGLGQMRSGNTSSNMQKTGSYTVTSQKDDTMGTEAEKTDGPADTPAGGKGNAFFRSLLAKDGRSPSSSSKR